ncbi:MAG TPA: cytochrome C oxidase subunit IV family protein [Verrucomicrobiae bacterium]|nr:cytochrome C oxidase subunit IV family protein [Verrucomicrobiae bacterium]
MNIIDPTKIYVKVWVGLLALLLLTWGIAQVHLGIWNLPVALTIAVLKMLLVILFFMHVRHSSKVTWVFVAAGFIWFAIMIDLTMTDFVTRRLVHNTSDNTQQLEKAQPPAARPATSASP